MKKTNGRTGDKMREFRAIPPMDQILNHEIIYSFTNFLGRDQTKEICRELLGTYRDRRVAGEMDALDQEALIAWLAKGLEKSQRSKLRRVINATGVIVHTNLGRAPLSEGAIERIRETGGRYSTLEYDLEAGRRGRRDDLVTADLCRLTGAEAALVVNNNAAAVFFLLKVLAEDREVILSRGELVEIGGSFRIPDVMRMADTELVEVGTTNKTHLRDYREAIGDKTAMIMKVHPSNFSLTGFTKSVPLEELRPLCDEKGLLLIDDLGSGNFTALHDEETVESRIAAGADLVTFSGDKLLGASQAGIIVGRTELIERLKSHPLYRALRVDKLTFAILEVSLRSYLAGRERDLPIHEMATRTVASLVARAEAICRILDHPALSEGPMEAKMGGGSLPGKTLPSHGLILDGKAVDTTALEKRLREERLPIIARLSDGDLLFDLRTVFEDEDPHLIEILGRLLEGGSA
jgi:L-seryl-tRNA(Ser) seleniumtransferase